MRGIANSGCLLKPAEEERLLVGMGGSKHRYLCVSAFRPALIVRSAKKRVN